MTKAPMAKYRKAERPACGKAAAADPFWDDEHSRKCLVKLLAKLSAQVSALPPCEASASMQRAIAIMEAHFSAKH